MEKNVETTCRALILNVMVCMMEVDGIIDEREGPQDYIGVEIKFMAFLCHRDMYAWKNQQIDTARKVLETEQAFLDDHLFTLIPDFTGKVVNAAKNQFYVGVVQLTENYTLMDLQNIDFILKTYT